MLVSALGPLQWVRAPVFGVPVFKGPEAALAGLAGAAFLAFGLPWGRPSPPGVSVRARVLAAMALSIGVWLPFAGLWGRMQGGAQGAGRIPLLLSVAAAIAVMAALAELNRRGGLRRAPGALLVLAWIGLASVILPGPPRLPAGAGGQVELGARGEWELIEADVELTGPLRSATLAYEGYPPLIIDANLLPGESTKARGWIVAPRDRSFAAHERPDLVDSLPLAPGGVAVRPLPKVSGSAGDPNFPDAEGEALPLLRRTLPAALAAGGQVPASAWLAAFGAALLLCLAVLRYGARLAFAPLALAVGVGAWQFCRGGPDAAEGSGLGQGGRPGDATIILEGIRSEAVAGGGTRWALIQRFSARYVSIDPSHPASGAQGLGSTPQARLRLGDPRGPAKTLLLISEDAPPIRLVEGRAADESLDVIQPSFDPGMRLLMREVNTFGAFEAAWGRTENGAWSGGDPWALGTAYQEDPPPESEPPLWAGAGLPMGVGVFMGRLEPASARALGLPVGAPDRPMGGASPKGRLGPAPTVWVRLVGF